MRQTIAVEKVTLYYLEQYFYLERTEERSFFPEWQGSLPELTDSEQQRLQRVREVVANLERRSVLENTVSPSNLSLLLPRI